jgi:hypothetical protein
MIMPEAINKLEDKLGRIFTVTKKITIRKRARSMVTLPAISPSQSTGSSLGIAGHT